MKTIILHFEWKLCGIMRIFEAFRTKNTTHLISDRFFDNEFSGVEFELILEIKKTLARCGGPVGIWLRQIGPTFTFEEVNTKYRIYAIKDNKRVDISRSTNKLENKEKLGYTAIELDKVFQYIPPFFGLEDGDLYLHCDVEITLYNPIKNLQDNYKKILDDGLFTDCVLKVGDEEIKAHRCILVQNNVVFKSMLADNGMLESQNCIVNISDTTPVCVRALLEYFYTGRINIGVLMNHVDDLFVVADKYQVTGLKFECERFMSNLIDSTNILKYCEIINLYGSTILEDACKDFVRVNWRDFFHCKEWEDIQNNYPKLAFNFMQFVIEDFDQTKNNYVLSTT